MPKGVGYGDFPKERKLVKKQLKGKAVKKQLKGKAIKRRKKTRD